MLSICGGDKVTLSSSLTNLPHNSLDPDVPSHHSPTIRSWPAKKVALPLAHVLQVFITLLQLAKPSLFITYFLQIPITCLEKYYKMSARQEAIEALEKSSVSYEELAEIEKQFDDAETEISECILWLH